MLAIIVAVVNVEELKKAQRVNPRITKEEYKGKKGESDTAIELCRLKCYKHIINDIILNDNGKTRQIDHIAITEKRNICN